MSYPGEARTTPGLYKNKRPQSGRLDYLAERKGFEPSIRYKRIHAFQACDFNHSSTSP